MKKQEKLLLVQSGKKHETKIKEKWKIFNKNAIFSYFSSSSQNLKKKLKLSFDK